MTPQSEVNDVLFLLDWNWRILNFITFHFVSSDVKKFMAPKKDWTCDCAQNLNLYLSLSRALYSIQFKPYSILLYYVDQCDIAVKIDIRNVLDLLTTFTANSLTFDGRRIPVFARDSWQVVENIAAVNELLFVRWAVGQQLKNFFETKTNDRCFLVEKKRRGTFRKARDRLFLCLLN